MPQITDHPTVIDGYALILGNEDPTVPVVRPVIVNPPTPVDGVPIEPLPPKGHKWVVTSRDNNTLWFCDSEGVEYQLPSGMFPRDVRAGDTVVAMFKKLKGKP